MSCKEVLRQLSAYLDGELDELSRKKVARHLEQCAMCGREMADLAQTVRIIRSVKAAHPPRDYLSALDASALSKTGKE